MTDVERKTHESWKKGRSLTALTLVAGWVFLAASSAYAWKPFTHVRLAYEAAQEAINTGSVTIYQTDYQTGEIKKDGTGRKLTFGTFQVRADLLAALRAFPEKYYAGVLGPDAYPDIVTGQVITHPPGGGTPGTDVNLNGPGTDFVLTRLWNKAHTEAATNANKAFVAGFIAHAAGDMFGHTYVNSYTGGIFNLLDPQRPYNNAMKHIALEGYIGERTPDLPASLYQNVTNNGIGNGVDDFIARFANPKYFGVDPGDEKSKSFPYLFATLLEWVQSKVDWYDGRIADFNRDIDHHMSLAAAHTAAGNRCRWYDTSCSSIWEYGQAAAHAIAAGGIVTARTGFQAIFYLPIEYCRNWVEDVQDGLGEWPRVSHRIAMALMFNAQKQAKWDQASNALGDFKYQFIRMLAPDFLATIALVIDAVQDFIAGLVPQWIRQWIHDAKRAILNWLVTKATGYSLDDLQEAFATPHGVLDTIYGNNNFRTGINSDLRLTDTGWNNPSEKFDYQRFPAAFNTVTMIKLSLMAPSEVNRLLQALGSGVRMSETLSGGVPANAMLGFNKSIDGSTQWRSSSQMVFARDCNAYGKIFMKVRPAPRSVPHVEPADDCRPVPPPLELVFASGFSVAAGGHQNYCVSEPADWTVVRWGGSADFGRLDVFPTKLCATYRAPSSIDRNREVLITARTSDGRTMDQFVTLLPDFRIIRHPFDGWAFNIKRISKGVIVSKTAPATREERKAVLKNVEATMAKEKQGIVKGFKSDLAVSASKPILGGGDLGAIISVRPAATIAGLLENIQLAQLPDDPLGPGGTRRFAVLPATPVTWRKASGPGTMSGDTYTAPSRLTFAKEFAVIRADATDASGRFATTTVRIEGTPTTPIVVIPRAVTLGGGGKQVFETAPAIPVTWSIVNPDATSGKFGDSQNAIHGQLEAELKPFGDALKAFAAKSFKHDSVMGEVAKFGNDVSAMLKSRRVAIANKGRQAAQALQTYFAPKSVTTRRTVTIKATANDGSGRTATATVTLVPGRSARLPKPDMKWPRLPIWVAPIQVSPFGVERTVVPAKPPQKFMLAPTPVWKPTPVLKGKDSGFRK